jgi:hypothetical protein
MGHDTLHELYILCVHATSVHSLIFERILSKFAVNILRLTMRGKDYVLFMFTHCVCERVCERDHVIKRPLIYGRILFKFAVNILQITTSSMGYVLCMFTHCAHACKRVVKHSLILGRILFKFAGHILQMTTNYMGYTRIMFTHRERARASVRVL